MAAKARKPASRGRDIGPDVHAEIRTVASALAALCVDSHDDRATDRTRRAASWMVFDRMKTLDLAECCNTYSEGARGKDEAHPEEGEGNTGRILTFVRS